MQEIRGRMAWSRDLADTIRAKWLAEPAGHRYVLVMLAVIATAVRIASLGSGVRYDERVTFAEFVSKPWQVALSSYPYPNNHLFHTLVEKIATGALGNALWVQ